MSNKTSVKSCKRLWILTILSIAAIWLANTDWMLSDLVIREFKAAPARDRARASVFGGSDSIIIDVSDTIKQLVPIGAPKAKVFALLRDTFPFVDVSATYEPIEVRDRHDEIHCATIRGPHLPIGLSGDEYSLCVFFRNDLLDQLKASWVRNL